MTVSDKLIRAKEDYDAVYDKGYSDGAAQGGGGYDQGFADGKQAEYDAFWDAYQLNGQRTVCDCMFSGSGWNTSLLKPKYSMSPTSAYYLFYRFDQRGSAHPSELDMDDAFKNRGLELDFSGCTDFTSMLFQANVRKFGTLDMSACNTATKAASVLNSEFLREVRCFIPPKCTMAASCFQVNLETIIVGGEVEYSMNLSRCGKLTNESITSVVNALSTEVSGQTLTLVKTAVNNAFDGGSTGSEWLNLIATKSNWTISLV